MVGAFFGINAEFLFPPASTIACKLKEGLLFWFIAYLFAQSLKPSYSAFSTLIKFSQSGDLHTTHMAPEAIWSTPCTFHIRRATDSPQTSQEVVNAQISQHACKCHPHQQLSDLHPA